MNYSAEKHNDLTTKENKNKTTQNKSRFVYNTMDTHTHTFSMHDVSLYRDIHLQWNEYDHQFVKRH